MSNYPIKKNINRGYMKLEVWQRSQNLFYLIWKNTQDQSLDYKLKSQTLNSAQSIPSNIAEGYSRRTLKDYIRFLYKALGSSAETLTRLIGLKAIKCILDDQFQSIEELHYEVENKLIALIKSLESKLKKGKEWQDYIAEEILEYLP